MPSLLPLNSAKIENVLDKIASQRLAMNLTPLDTHPQTCPVQLLPWLAAMWRVDIAGLNEQEQRQLILNALEIHRYKGTVYAVQKALDTVFNNAVIIEFKNVFEFAATVTLKADPNSIYSSDKFTTARKLVNTAKNARSRFTDFAIKLPDVRCAFKKTDAAIIKPVLNTGLTLQGQTNPVIQGAMIWTL